MPLSSLSTRGISQETSGAALDVWAKTIELDEDLREFHKGNVKIHSNMPTDTENLDSWSVVAYSSGFDNTDPNVGGLQEGVRLSALFVWPELSIYRKYGESSVADLDMMFRIAIYGGTRASGAVVEGNPTLIWKNAWPAPPAGFAGQVGLPTAVSAITRDVLASDHGSTVGRLADTDDKCYISMALFEAVFGVVRSRC